MATALRNLEIHRKVFQVLFEIADQHKLSQTQIALAGWRKKADQSRVSEIHTMAFSTATDIDRILSVDKCVKMMRALIKLVGFKAVKKDILKAIKEEKDPMVRLILMVSVLKKTQHEVEQFVAKKLAEEPED